MHQQTLTYTHPACSTALDSLYEHIISTMIGLRFIACITLGCVTRFLISNHEIIIRLLVGRDDTTADPFDILYHWFAKDVSHSITSCIVMLWS